jgi:RNA polymerase sigma factor (sigma-70 family)
MVEETSDAELLVRARRQDREAVAALYARHEPAARRLASTYSRAGDPDDLVSEAFFRVLGAIERGHGPEDSFRAYLFVTLRRVAMEAISRSRDEPVDEIPEPVREAEREPELDPDDRLIILTAYASLPARQQSMLWQTEVEGQRPRELAPVLGLTANTVSAQASRARDRLREAYLQAHVATTAGAACEPHRSRLGAYVRDRLAPLDLLDTEEHLEACDACRDLAGELTDINARLVRSLVPFFLLGTPKVAAVAGGAAAGAGTTGGTWAAVSRWIAKGRSNAGATAAAGVAACGLAAVVAGGLLGAAGPDRSTASGSPETEDDGGPTLATDSPAESAPADAASTSPAPSASVSAGSSTTAAAPAPTRAGPPDSTTAIDLPPAGGTSPTTATPPPATSEPPGSTPTTPPPPTTDPPDTTPDPPDDPQPCTTPDGTPGVRIQLELGEQCVVLVDLFAADPTAPPPAPGPEAETATDDPAATTPTAVAPGETIRLTSP